MVGGGDLSVMRDVMAAPILYECYSGAATSSASLDALLAELRGREALHAQEGEQLRAFRLQCLLLAKQAGREEVVRALS